MFKVKRYSKANVTEGQTFQEKKPKPPHDLADAQLVKIVKDFLLP